MPKKRKQVDQNGFTNGSAESRDDMDARIRARAYELYLERGGQDGSEMDDWIRAEKDFRDRQPEP